MRIVLASTLFTALGFGFPAAALAADAPPAAPPPAPAPMVVAASPDCGCCPAPDPCRKSRLEIQGHLAMLTPDPEGIVTVDTGAPGQTTWDDLDYDPEIGGRVAFTFPWTCWDVTIAGTWWGSWEGDHTTSGTTLTSTPVPGGPFNTSPPFDVVLHEEATLWDVNLVFMKAWTCSPCFNSRWGFGARWLHFDEEASFEFPVGVVALTTGSFASDIDNDLIAAELVAEGVWKLSGCWDFLARGSVFAGWMHREGEMSAVNITPPITGASDEQDDFGFGGELEIALRWHPSACWSLSLGYGLLALGNVTRAHEAFDFSNAGVLDIGPVFEDDLLLVHRVFVGVGFNF
jgi:hypothetical protein